MNECFLEPCLWHISTTGCVMPQVVNMRLFCHYKIRLIMEMIMMTFRVPAGPGHFVFYPRWFLGHRWYISKSNKQNLFPVSQLMPSCSGTGNFMLIHRVFLLLLEAAAASHWGIPKYMLPASERQSEPWPFAGVGPDNMKMINMENKKLKVNVYGPSMSIGGCGTGNIQIFLVTFCPK